MKQQKYIVEMSEQEYNKCKKILDEGIITHKINSFRFNVNKFARNLTVKISLKLQGFFGNKFIDDEDEYIDIDYDKLYEMCKSAITNEMKHYRLTKLNQVDLNDIVDNIARTLVGYGTDMPILDLIGTFKSGLENYSDGNFDEAEVRKLVFMCVKEVVNDMKSEMKKA